MIIEPAGKLIKQEIKYVSKQKDTYPQMKDLTIESALEYLPPCLNNLLTNLITQNGDRKIARFDQAIMQSCHPISLLASLQIGLGIHMHHMYQSKMLVDVLSNLGFSCSYQEVQCFERSASVAHQTDILNMSAEQFLQYSADNVDHNIRSLGGKGTFHGMGMIALVTPKSRVSRVIPRLKAVSDTEVINIA